MLVHAKPEVRVPRTYTKHWNPGGGNGTCNKKRTFTVENNIIEGRHILFTIAYKLMCALYLEWSRMMYIITCIVLRLWHIISHLTDISQKNTHLQTKKSGPPGWNYNSTKKIERQTPVKSNQPQQTTPTTIPPQAHAQKDETLDETTLSTDKYSKKVSLFLSA